MKKILLFFMMSLFIGWTVAEAASNSPPGITFEYSIDTQADVDADVATVILSHEYSPVVGDIIELVYRGGIVQGAGVLDEHANVTYYNATEELWLVHRPPDDYDVWSLLSNSLLIPNVSNHPTTLHYTQIGYGVWN